MSAEVPEAPFEHGPDAVRTRPAVEGPLHTFFVSSVYCVPFVCLTAWVSFDEESWRAGISLLFTLAFIAPLVWTHVLVFRRVAVIRGCVMSDAGVTVEHGEEVYGASWDQIDGASILHIPAGSKTLQLDLAWVRNIAAIAVFLRRHGIHRVPTYSTTNPLPEEPPVGPERPRAPSSYRTQTGRDVWTLPSPWHGLAHGVRRNALGLSCAFAAAAAATGGLWLTANAPTAGVVHLRLPCVFVVLMALQFMMASLPGVLVPHLRWRRRQRFLGPRLVRAARGLWVTPDGSRRSRCRTEDRGLAWDIPTHFHLEELEDGVTRSSYAIGADNHIAEARYFASAHAVVQPVDWTPRCFRGPPGHGRALGEPRHLLRQDLGDGWLLTRFDASLGYAGDTWHATEQEVALQIEREMGVGVTWRVLGEAPTDFTFLVG